MNEKLKNFIIRAITGLVYVVLLLGCTLWSPISAFLFFGAVAVATLWEFSTLMNNHAGASIARHLNALAGLLLISSVWLYVSGSESTSKMLGLYGLIMMYLLISELYRKAENPLKNWALVCFSQIYVAVPFALIPLLSVFYNPESGGYVYKWIYPVSLFVFLWSNDTGAYLFGSMLHKKFPAKLFPRISPNKSWVGSIGGGILTLLVSVVAWKFAGDGMTLLKWLGFALVVVFFGTWGDLIESLLKRHLGIKDSGHVLPGHGGMLDRFDSSLLAIPASVIYLMYIG